MLIVVSDVPAVGNGGHQCRTLLDAGLIYRRAGLEKIADNRGIAAARRRQHQRRDALARLEIRLRLTLKQ
ncbi:hypothetical protein NUKP66_38250 [Klebsiella variicola]|nr:hypothetical protein NUKP66_38250 [Klebsiella variicola]